MSGVLRRAHGPEATTDLWWAAAGLAAAGRRSDALALIERVVAEARSTEAGDLAGALVEYGRQLLLQERFEEAVAALQQAVALGSQYSLIDAHARYLLIAALGKAGRYEELSAAVAEHLWFLRVIAWFGVARRRMYVALLEMLVECWSAAGREPDRQAAEKRLRTQRRILRRQLARRRALWAPVRALNHLPRRGPYFSAAGDAKRLAKRRARMEAEVAQQIAEVQRLRDSGDSYALAAALAELGLVRWRTGGQRSAALAAQRETVELTRQLAREDAVRTTPLLAERLRRFAEWAEIIGLHTDAEAAKAEATHLEAHQPPSLRGR